MPSVRVARLSAASLVVLAVLVSAPPHAIAEEPGIDLGTAESFAILAATGITNTGATTVTGDVGSHPNGAFTSTGSFTLTGSSTNHGNDAVTAEAKDHLVTAYETAENALPETEIAAQLGGETLYPGVYTSETGAFLLTGTLTLDAEGVRDAQFIFKAGSEITTASNSVVRLINSADPCHVVWQITSSATFGTGTTFVGDVMALISITANAGATFEGRLLARNGAVTLNNNTITAGACRAGATVTAATPTPSQNTGGSSTSPAPTAAPTTSPDLGTAGSPGVPTAGGPDVTGGPALPATGWWLTAYVVTGVVLIRLGMGVVRTGNGCRPGRRAVRHLR